MRDIRRLNPKNISARGCYFSNNEIFWLTDQEILELRRYYNDPNIASAKKIISQEELKRRKLKLQKQAAYKKAKLRLIGGTLLIMSGITVAVFTHNIKGSDIDYETKTVYSEPTTIYSEADNHVVPEIELNTEVVTSGSIQITEEQVRQQLVRKYCNIYQINYDVVYNRLVELTDNFTSQNFKDGYIEGVTCKGEVIYAKSEEELFLYFCRCAKQLPDNIGIDTSNLYIDNDYKSTNTYGEDINYYSNLLNEDPILIYAIVQAETSFNSELFIKYNNPAGIRFGGPSFEHFSTKEEGFIEFILEVKKYRRWGAETLEEIRDIHAPLSDGNYDWLGNVSEIYASIELDPNRYLGNYIRNDKLKS